MNVYSPRKCNYAFDWNYYNFFSGIFFPKYHHFIEGTGRLNDDINRIAVLCYHHLAPMGEGLHE